MSALLARAIRPIVDPISTAYSGMKTPKWLIAAEGLLRRSGGKGIRPDAVYRQMASAEVNEQIHRAFSRLGPPPAPGNDEL